MRLLRLTFLLALLIGVSAAAYSFLGGDGPFRREIGITPEETRQADQAEKIRKDAELASLPQPAFDIVRVEATGELVAAGTAPPGWTISIETDAGVIGKVTAEFDGSWVFMPGAPLPAGEHSLGLRAQAPDGSREIVASQRVAVSVSGQREAAVVAVSEDDKPTRVLQSGVIAAEPSPRARETETEAETSRPARPLAFSAVDYTDERETGRLAMSGVAAPGARIALYLDNRFIGSAQAGADGAWQFSLTDVLQGGEHMLRADHVDMARGEVLSRAEIRFDPSGVAIGDAVAGETRIAAREDETRLPASTEPETPRARTTAQPDTGVEPAAAEPGRSATARAAMRAREPETSVAAADIRAAGEATLPETELPVSDEASAAAADAQAPSQPAAPRAATPARKTAIVVRRGDTLWHIAKQYYGSGVRYTQIFRSNRDQIRSPHRIYPGQRFDLPQ